MKKKLSIVLAAACVATSILQPLPTTIKATQDQQKLSSPSVKSVPIIKVQMKKDESLKNGQVPTLFQYEGTGKKDDIKNYKEIKKLELSGKTYETELKYEAKGARNYAVKLKEQEFRFFHLSNNSLNKKAETSTLKEITAVVDPKEPDKDKTKSTSKIQFMISNLTEYHEAISNASFEIYASEDIISDGEIVIKKDEKITEIHANEQTELSLYQGSYYVKQTSVPDGYVVHPKKEYFTVAKMEDSTIQNIEFEYENAITKIHIMHTDQDENLVLGGTYRLLDSAGKTIQIFHDLEDGVQVNGLTEGAIYKIEQVKSISGYQNMQDFEFVVNGANKDGSYIDQNINLKSNYISAHITFKTKQDGTVKNIRGIKAHIKGKGFDESWTSEIENPVKTMKKVPEGKYELVIDQVPEGFKLPETTSLMINDKEQNQNFTIMIEPEETMIQIVDKENGTILSGIMGNITDSMMLPVSIFDFTKKEGYRIIDGVTNNQESELNSITALPIGTFYYQMKTGLEGYATDTAAHKISAGINKINLYPIKVDVSVNDKETDKTIQAEGKVVNSSGQTVYSGDLNHLFIKIPAGKYQIRTTKVPKGYNNAQFPITIKDQKELQDISCKVSPINATFSSKYGDKDIKDIKAQLRNKQGEVVYEWVSNDSPHLISKIEEGTYTLHYVAVPKQFVTPKDQEITIKEKKEVQSFGSQLTRPAATIKAMSNGQMLKGIKFEISNEQGSYTTPKTMSTLNRGQYTVHVTQVPKGYIRPIDQKIEIKDSMEEQEFLIPIDFTKVSFQTVVKEYGKSLKGVKVRLKGTNYGFISTFDKQTFEKIPIGTYQLQVLEVQKGFRIPKDQEIIIKETSGIQNFKIQVGVAHDTKASELIQMDQENNIDNNNNNDQTELTSSQAKTGEHSMKIAYFGCLGGLLGSFMAFYFYKKNKNKLNYPDV